MADRTVKVTLTAVVAGYIANTQRAGAATRELAKSTTDAKAKLEQQNQSMTKLGVGMAAAGAVAAAGLALVIKASTEYGAKMAQLQALSHASADEMKQLSDAAMTQGQAFGFTASQVADAEIELTKAGIGVKAQLGGALKGALELAAAGQIDVGQATEYATVAMTQFGLSAAQVPHLADLMAAGADKALGSVGDLGEALKNGGLQAHNMGLTIDDTIGLLSAFANAGIIGAEAGTQMRSMFIQLQRPSSQAKKVLDDYGISLSDASGKFVGITKLGDELRDKLGGLTQAQRNTALATIFGSHAITGATVLYQDSGAAAEKAGLSISDWIKNVNDSGFASAQAAGKMNSLQGDFQKLSAAFQTDMIKMGTTADSSLRGVTQSLTNVVVGFGNLPAPVQGGVLATTALVAGVGLLGGAFLLAVPKIAEFKLALEKLNVTGRQATGVFGKGTAILAGVTAITAGFAAAGIKGEASAQQVELAATSIGKSWKGVNGLFGGNSLIGPSAGIKSALDQSFGNGGWNSSAAAHWLKGATLGMVDFTAVYEKNEGQFNAFGKQLAGLAKTNYGAAASSFNQLVKAAGGGHDAVVKLTAAMPDYRDQIVSLLGKLHIAATDQNVFAAEQRKGAVGAKVAAEAQREAAAAAAKNASQLAKLTGSGNDATQSVNDLQNALQGLGSTQLDARSAARAFQQAIDDATKAARTNGRSLDINTQQGRDNQAALDGIASSADQAAAAYVKNGGSAAGAARIIANGRSAYIRTAESMGLSKAAANRLADALHLIPKSVTTAANITGAGDVLSKIANIRSAMNNIDGDRANIYINEVLTGASTGRAAQVAKNAGLADGGAIDGPGPKGKDSVLALVAPGEHVWTDREVDAVGGQSAMYRMRAMARAGTLPRFASGGAASHIASLRKSYLADVAAGKYGSASNYVSELDRIAKDTKDFSTATRRHYEVIAAAATSAIKKLESSSSAAATKLKDLQSAAGQVKSGIVSSIMGGYRASDAGATAQASGWAMSNGVRVQTYTAGVSAKSLQSYYSSGAAKTKAFASQLQRLAARGANASLLEEIANYGTDAGSPIAGALLSASKSQLTSIDSNYAAIGKYAGTAGSAVANASYKAQISAADKNTKTLVAALNRESASLRKVIGHALHVRGYASGTLNATEGLHWVGENGPELMYLRAGTQVYPRRWMSGASGSSFPSQVTLVDMDGGILTRARVQTTGQIRDYDRAMRHRAVGSRAIG